MLGRLHLVRHGEVGNPRHVVYADLPGFPLSANGRSQAEAAATHLASWRIEMIVGSPLDRAVETAEIIAARTRSPLVCDERLTEWRLGMRWAGTPWEDLPREFPGELEAYLDHPQELPFAPESIDEVAARVIAVIDEYGVTAPGGEVVMVSHQDPVQAARLVLTGRSLGDLPLAKPAHCAVITLEPGTPWREIESWEPPEARAFPPAGPQRTA